MLVLSRKPGESITIGPAIEITVVDVRGSRVVLAIDAPPSVTILRKELQQNPTGVQATGIRERVQN